jgi:sugar phosphate isomerase/epimerase
MKTLPIAIQIFSVRHQAAADFAGTMQTLRQLGYEAVELAGLYGLPVRAVKEALDQAGMPAISAHVPFSQMRENISQVIADYTLLGCRSLAIPCLGERERPGGADFATTLRDIRRIGNACRNSGLDLLYHNHYFEFCAMPDGQLGLDYIFAQTTPEQLQTQIDSCWVDVAGHDPAAYIRKYTGRAPLVHIKDFTLREPSSRSGDIEADILYQPLGQGQADVPALLDAALAAGSQWIIVEEESTDRLPFEGVAASRAYLRSLGW